MEHNGLIGLIIVQRWAKDEDVRGVGGEGHPQWWNEKNINKKNETEYNI